MDTKIKRGQVLKELRLSKKLNQTALATLLGISLTAYQKYEHGTAEPNFDNLSKLADFYNVTTDYLLGREPLPDPFADFHLTKEIEDDMLKKYLALPEGVRACVMDAIRQLGKTMPDDTQNGSEGVTDDYITITERAGDIVDQVENADEKDGVS